MEEHIMRRYNGFTLIELLVVISIIAILMAVMMPALQKVKQQAQEMRCQSNLRNYGLAMAMYHEDHLTNKGLSNLKAGRI